jgi:hypothetical protein
MKITQTVKVLLLVSLALVMAISYVVNKSNQQTEIAPSSNDVSTGNETVEEYNQRKKEEVNQRRKKAEALKDRKSEHNAELGRKLTVDGYDPAIGGIIDPINLWENYATRTYAGKLRHGEIVTLIRREGDGVFVQKKSGLRGWVTYFFIKEFNEEAKKRGDK